MKIGLVLAGGGGKGAYQMGVWKAFKEFNIDFDVISGTSIGALNGLLMAMDQYELADQMWLSVQDKMNDHLGNAMGSLSDEKLYLMDQCFKNPETLRNHVGQPGIIDTTLIKEQLLKIVDGYDIKKNIYVSAVNAMTVECEYFQLKGAKPEEIVNKAWASASLPVIFDAVNIYGADYYDGGILDNVPIAPLLAENCDLIFVVLLKSKNTGLIKTNGKIPIIPIIPSMDLGEFEEGTMNFKTKDIIAKKELGYEDAKKLLTTLDKLFA